MCGVKAERPEFEPMISLGSKCELSDLEPVVRLDNLCSRMGIDNISAGITIAFAMDLYERGILTPGLTGGLDLSWGNAEAMIENSSKPSVTTAESRNDL